MTPSIDSGGPQPSTPGGRIANDLDIIGPSEWSDLVAAAVGSDRAEVVDWRSEQIYAGLGAGTRLYRVTGTAAVGSPGSVPWRMILKFFTFDLKSFESLGRRPSDWNYWQREWSAYRSSWQQDLCGSLVAPRCFGSSDATDGNAATDTEQAMAWVALEDLGDHARDWTPPEFGAVACQVGEFNGVHADGTFEREPWHVPRDWLRGWAEQSAGAIEQLSSGVDGPVAQRLLPARVSTQLLRLWADRDQLFAALDRLPTTLAHNDVFPRNLFRAAGPAGSSVAVDWAFAGPAPVGAELAAMVGAGQVFFGSPPDEWEEVERECLAGYLRGLRQAGYPADPAEVEAGYLLSYVLRFGVGTVVHDLQIALLPASNRAEISRAIGPYDLLVDRLESRSWFRQPRIRRARALLGL